MVRKSGFNVLKPGFYPGINYQTKLVSRISEPSTVSLLDIMTNTYLHTLQAMPVIPLYLLKRRRTKLSGEGHTKRQQASQDHASLN